jgi:hypothetical protein
MRDERSISPVGEPESSLTAAFKNGHTELRSLPSMQPLISLLLQSAAFKPGFRAFKHLAASAISRGCVLYRAYFFRGIRMALPRLLPGRTDAAMDAHASARSCRVRRESRSSRIRLNAKSGFR